MSEFSPHDAQVIEKFITRLWNKGQLSPLQELIMRDELKKVLDEADKDFTKAQNQENPGRIE